LGEQRAKHGTLPGVDEGRKRVLGIMAAILAARKLAEQEHVRNVPATICAIADAVLWAERILAEIDRKWPLTTETHGG
jgi:cellobiose-specific phosphotransferase system component IIC